MKNKNKTIIFTLILCLAVILLSAFVQLKSQKNISVLSCSYLDPITIDVLAFLAAIFLIFEGMYRIWEHKEVNLKKQITRSFRIAFGCAILTLHIMQFIYK